MVEWYSPLHVKSAYLEIAAVIKYHLAFDVASHTKPLGTGHAILSCDGIVDSPFAVINANDYYGKNGFIKAVSFLGSSYGLVGYILKNTLSDNGGVTRGICSVTDGILSGIKETKNIVKMATGAAVDGVAVDAECLVSMDFWCYPVEFMDVLRECFPKFLEGMKDPMRMSICCRSLRMASLRRVLSLRCFRLMISGSELRIRKISRWLLKASGS